jgi:DNA-directed RNA polymerase subunit omega
MLHPSYTELMEKINIEDNEGEEPVINSRYSIVIATSRRARDLISGSKARVAAAEGEKPLSVAVEELYDGKLKITGEDENDPIPVPTLMGNEQFEELKEIDPAFSNE